MRPPTYSPWGDVQNCNLPIPGQPIWQVSTTTHGGIMIASSYANEHLTRAARIQSLNWPGYHCFEEDAQYAIAHWEIAELRASKESPIPPVWDAHLYQTLLHYYPDYLAQIATPFYSDYHYQICANGTASFGFTIEWRDRHGKHVRQSEDAQLPTQQQAFDQALLCLRQLRHKVDIPYNPSPFP